MLGIKAVKMPGLAAHTLNLSTWEAQTGLCVEFWARQFCRDPVSKDNENMKEI